MGDEYSVELSTAPLCRQGRVGHISVDMETERERAAPPVCRESTQRRMTEDL